ncbi:hypothetical protein [Jiangella alba]|uniref:Integral membrane protein n=1 Tax=Jiangella alba TaxID=561176 RepID=A0A1H5MDH8_9ACTN|nr:hypothetical protein [Jiangella alba]SEE86751.1 hypothetical protein SAMN04488561_3063 [Jiangella alba]
MSDEPRTPPTGDPADRPADGPRRTGPPASDSTGAEGPASEPPASEGAAGGGGTAAAPGRPAADSTGAGGTGAEAPGAGGGAEAAGDRPASDSTGAGSAGAGAQGADVEGAGSAGAGAQGADDTVTASSAAARRARRRRAGRTPGAEAADTPSGDEPAGPGEHGPGEHGPGEHGATDGGAGEDGLGAGDRAELERLRTEVAQLRAAGTAAGEAPVGPASPARAQAAPGGRWRAWLAPVLIFIGCVLAIPATAAVWVDSVVTNTDRYVETVGPLARNPDIERAVTNRVTNRLMQEIDVPGVVKEASDLLAAQGARPRLTSTLNDLAGPIGGAVQGWVHDQVGTVVASDRFADAWTQANRAAHQALVAALTGKNENGAVQVEGNTVSIQLAPVIEDAKQRLVDAGFSRASAIPSTDMTLTLFQSDDVEKAQAGFRLIDRLGTWLPVIALAFIAAGVLVARGRRRALVGAGIGLALAMLVLGAALTIARPVYLGALPPEVDDAAAGALFDQVVSLLRTTLRMVLAAGLAVALVAWLTGPSPQAVAVRRGVARLGDVGTGWGWRNSSTAVWLRRHKRPVQIAVLSVAVLVFVFWNYPNAAVVLGILLIAGVLLAALELATGQAAPSGPSAARPS